MTKRKNIYNIANAYERTDNKCIKPLLINKEDIKQSMFNTFFLIENIIKMLELISQKEID